MSGLSLGTRKILWLILFAVFAVSLSYSFYFQVEPAVDARAYSDTAWNLVRGYGYVTYAENHLTPEMDGAIGRVGPGYQFFLAMVYGVFGLSLWVVWILHAVFRALTAFIIFKIVLYLFRADDRREKIGLLAAALFGFSPDLITLNGLLLTETLFLLLLATAVYSLLKTFENPTGNKALLSSLFLGFAVLTRPVIFLILIFVSLIFIFQRKPAFVFLLFLFPALFITPWAIRNWNVYDHVILTSSTGGYDLWVGNNPEATGGFDKTDEIAEFRRTYGIVEADKKGWREYFSFVRGDPLKFIDLQYDKFAIYFSLLRPTGFWDHLGSVGKILTLGSSFLWTAVIFGFGLPGLFLMGEWSADYFRKRIFVLFAFLQPLAVIPVIVESRYRAAFFLFLAVSAAFFMVRFFYERADRNNLKKMLGSSIVFLILIFIWDFVGNVYEVVGRISTLK